MYLTIILWSTITPLAFTTMLYELIVNKQSLDTKNFMTNLKRELDESGQYAAIELCRLAPKKPLAQYCLQMLEHKAWQAEDFEFDHEKLKNAELIIKRKEFLKGQLVHKKMLSWTIFFGYLFATFSISESGWITQVLSIISFVLTFSIWEFTNHKVKLEIKELKGNIRALNEVKRIAIQTWNRELTP